MLFGALVGSMIFVSLWSITPLLVHFHEFLLFERRLNEFQMYMTAGGMMMIGMSLLLPFVVHPGTPRKVRWSAVIVLIPLGVNLLFTFTRSSWLGFLASAVVIGAVRAKKLMLVLGGVVVFIVALSTPEMQDRMSSIFNPFHHANIGRLHMWEAGVKMFMDHPVVGVGDIGIEQVWPAYSQPEWEVAGHLHNNVLMWLVTLGVVGCAVLVTLFVKIWIVVARIERMVRTHWFFGSVALGTLAVYAGFHVNGLFEWNFGDAEIIALVWALLGMTLAVEKLAPNEGDSLAG
jgi:O-antigen ligase